MRRIVPTKLHGAIDYLAAATLVAAPRALGWDRRVVSALDALAGATVAYSLLTDYELGVVRALPMTAHLAIDGVNAATTLALPLLLGVRDRGVAATLAGFAVFEAAITLASQTEPSPERVAGRVLNPS